LQALVSQQLHYITALAAGFKHWGNVFVKTEWSLSVAHAVPGAYGPIPCHAPLQWYRWRAKKTMLCWFCSSHRSCRFPAFDDSSWPVGSSLVHGFSSVYFPFVTLWPLRRRLTSETSRVFIVIVIVIGYLWLPEPAGERLISAITLRDGPFFTTATPSGGKTQPEHLVSGNFRSGHGRTVAHLSRMRVVATEDRWSWQDVDVAEGCTCLSSRVCSPVLSLPFSVGQLSVIFFCLTNDCITASYNLCNTCLFARVSSFYSLEFAFQFISVFIVFGSKWNTEA